MRLLLLLFLFCPAAFAQPTGAIGGRILDDLGDPLPGANVVLEGTQLGTATDIDGRFFVNEIPIGQYEVTASFVGYQSQTDSVRIFAGRTHWLAFVFSPVVVYDMSHEWPYLECDSERSMTWTPLVSPEPFAPRVLSGEEIACLPIER